MSASQQHIASDTPMGATLVDGGATFRVWAPRAREVYVALGDTRGYRPRAEDQLVRGPTPGHWTGFVPDVVDGAYYRFYVVGAGAGLKRDPWARELEPDVPLEDCDCVVRATGTYPWHDASFRPPAFNDLVVYQLHVGVFSARDDHGRDLRGGGRVAKLLDAVERLEYLADLGVNAVQPLPVVEFHGEWSLGYNGTDLFSPETDYCVPRRDLAPYVDRVNALLATRGHPPVHGDQLAGQVNQLKAFVDLCHVFGIAVLMDVVYNHAGGGLDAHSLDYLDMPPDSDRTSLYFSDRELAGGKIFAFGKPEVRSFLIENATTFLGNYHADGLRFDEVTVIDGNGGWSLCQDLTSTLRYRKPSAALIAEYWGEQRWLATQPAPTGMGFDLGYSDGLRDGVRDALAQAAGGATAHVDLAPVRRGLRRPYGTEFAWQAYNCLENHDLVLDADGDHRHPRIARLAGGDDTRSWYARSRARVATGLLLTAPGVPMLFMGQEFLEDKLWSDDPHRDELMIWWDGLDRADRHMADFHHCTRDLINLRRRLPALRSEPVVVYPLDDTARVLAFHRWVPGIGKDVVVVSSLAETTFHGDFHLGFPARGPWHEAFNSDYYDHLPNPWVQGNNGPFPADDDPRHDMPHSARITLPANSILVFTTDPDG